MHEGSAVTLDDVVRELTWVRVAGYSLEKIHTGVLVHALNRGTADSHALAVALWQRVAGDGQRIDEVTHVHAQGEVSVDEGRDSVVDLLVTITTPRGALCLGIEVKVDASPRREQLTRLRDGVKRRSNAPHAVALLALGAAQVCRVERGDVEGVTRLSTDDVSKLAPRLHAAGEPAIVDPWLREIEFERVRRDAVNTLIEADARHFGYRVRTWRAYERAQLASRLEEAGGGRWSVSIQSHNVVLTSERSWRRLSPQTPSVLLYLELTEQDLCLKAGSWEGGPEPRGLASPIAAHALAAWRAAGLDVKPGRAKRGSSTTMGKVSIAGTEDPVARIVAALGVWEAAWTSRINRGSAAT